MTSPITVTDNTKVFDVVKLIVKKNVGFVPVISSETGKLVGVISEKDLVGILCCDPESKHKEVGQFATKEVITVTPENTLKEVLEKFIDYKIRHLPVVRDQRVVGVVSVKDALKLI